MALLRVSLLVSVLLLVSGCVPLRQGGTTHYLVLGIGVVSVNRTNQAVAEVTRANALGVMASRRGLTVGYAAETSVGIKTNENVVIEVKQAPLKPLSVCVPPSSH